MDFSRSFPWRCTYPDDGEACSPHLILGSRPGGVGAALPWSPPGDPGTGPWRWLLLDEPGRGDAAAGTAAPGDPYAFTPGPCEGDPGLAFLGARSYDPTLGRWLSEDPAGFVGADANLYRYVAPALVPHPPGA